MDYNQLADLLFPNIDKTPDFWEKKYPPRDLPAGAEVMRFSPSPTGFLHIGSLYTCMIGRLILSKFGGVFYLRIEDTDEKREVENSAETIISGLRKFGIHFDEGRLAVNQDTGNYGPYLQSERKEIYQTYAKDLVRKGLAYPCFCSADKLDKMRELQEANKEPLGYYGKYAVCRNLSFDKIKSKIEAGDSFVLRFRCPYKEGDMMQTFDLVRGERTIPANIVDVVIIKSNGMPPYNLAHAVDDHLMRTTIVTRGEEWLPSLSEHLELFEALGFKAPQYAHFSSIQKLDAITNERRKLSKRKDPEADVEYFAKAGYPVASITEYLVNLANSNFETWRLNNPTLPISEFDFSINKLNTSGALFDIVKLNDVSKNVISRMSANEVYTLALNWAEKFDLEFADVLKENKEYCTSILNIDRDIPKPRKDIVKMDEIRDIYDYMFDKDYIKGFGYNPEKITFPENFKNDSIKAVLTKYPSLYEIDDDQSVWFDKIKDLASEIGFAREVKDYKKNPTAYLGHCGDISTIIRVALTGRTMTPNLYNICKLLGKEKITQRMSELAKKL